MKEHFEKLQELGYNLNQDVIPPNLVPVINGKDIYFFNVICGIVLEPRNNGDNHVCIRYLFSDDGFWYENWKRFSTGWLEYIKELQEHVYKYLDSSNLFIKTKDGYYYK